MVLALDEPWQELSVSGRPAGRSQRALEPLPASLSLVPRVRPSASTQLELRPGLDWYCVELSRTQGFSANELSQLQDVCDLWIAVGRAGGLSELTPSYDVPRAMGLNLERICVG